MAKASFYKEEISLKISLTFIKGSGYFCETIFCPEILKITQSGHTGCMSKGQFVASRNTVISLIVIVINIIALVNKDLFV